MAYSNCTGRNLRDLRKEKGLTQQQLVALLSEYGLSMQVCTLCKLERGVRRINDYELKSFADVLDIEIADLFANVSIADIAVEEDDA